ncbi:hypothetical protein JCM8547_009008 [Rhodosporidiobolus lusitaniae]
MSATLADALAEAALTAYAALPAKGKPSRRSNGQAEWTVLAAFLIFRHGDEGIAVQWEVRCVSLGTGLKALPHSRLPVHGDVLHDSHAEVVARRSLHLWMYQELLRAVQGEETALERVEKEDGKAEWRLGIGWQLGMYVSTLPCGDASTYLLSLQAPASAESCEAAPPVVSTVPPSTSELTKPPEPALHPSLSTALSLGLNLSRSSPSPSSSSPSLATLPSSSSVIRGRNGYTHLSTLRTKPGRADSPPTTSHSCSDKLAMWALLGAQGGLLSALGVGRVKLEMLVVGDEGVPEEEGEREKVRGEVRRAVGGRVEGWAKKVGLGEEEFEVMEVDWTERVFEHSREKVAEREKVGKEELAGCAETLSFVLGASPAVEVVTNGIRQGASSKRKPGEALGAKYRSRLSKLSLYQKHLEVQRALASSSSLHTPPSPLPSSSTYYSAKHPPLPPLPASTLPTKFSSLPPGERYQLLKALVRRGASPTHATEERVGPFAGWLVSGERWESFDGEGRVVELSRGG